MLVFLVIGTHNIRGNWNEEITLILLVVAHKLCWERVKLRRK